MFLEVTKLNSSKELNSSNEARLVNTRLIRSIDEIKTSNNGVFTRILLIDNAWFDVKESYSEIRSKLYNAGEII